MTRVTRWWGPRPNRSSHPSPCFERDCPSKRGGVLGKSGRNRYHGTLLSLGWCCLTVDWTVPWCRWGLGFSDHLTQRITRLGLSKSPSQPLSQRCLRPQLPCGEARACSPARAPRRSAPGSPLGPGSVSRGTGSPLDRGFGCSQAAGPWTLGCCLLVRPWPEGPLASSLRPHGLTPTRSKAQGASGRPSSPSCPSRSSSTACCRATSYRCSSRSTSHAHSQFSGPGNARGGRYQALLPAHQEVR